MDTVSNITTAAGETVNSIASAATRALWGEGSTGTAGNADDLMHQEPVAGETGDVTKGEPYDKGNVEATTTESNPPHETTSILPTDSATTNPSNVPLPAETPIQTQQAVDPLAAAGSETSTAAAAAASVTVPTPSEGPRKLEEAAQDRVATGEATAATASDEAVRDSVDNDEADEVDDGKGEDGSGGKKRRLKEKIKSKLHIK